MVIKQFKDTRVLNSFVKKYKLSRRNGNTKNNTFTVIEKNSLYSPRKHRAFQANNTIKNMPEQICLTLLHRIIGSVP